MKLLYFSILIFQVNFVISQNITKQHNFSLYLTGITTKGKNYLMPDSSILSTNYHTKVSWGLGYQLKYKRMSFQIGLRTFVLNQTWNVNKVTTQRYYTAGETLYRVKQLEILLGYYPIVRKKWSLSAFAGESLTRQSIASVSWVVYNGTKYDEYKTLYQATGAIIGINTNIKLNNKWSTLFQLYYEKTQTRNWPSFFDKRGVDGMDSFDKKLYGLSLGIIYSLQIKKSD